MKQLVSLVLAAFAGFWVSAQIVVRITGPVKWVNALMSTNSKLRLFNGNSYPVICVRSDMNCWTLQTGNMAHGVPKKFRNYLVVVFVKPFAYSGTWRDSTLKATASLNGAFIGFATKKGERLHTKVSSSFISHEAAKVNRQRELGREGFDLTR